MARFWGCGPIVGVHLAGDDSRSSVALNGVIDTGASVICMDKRFALQLNLTLLDRKFMQMADGSETRATVHSARLIIPELEVNERADVYAVLMDRPSNRILLGRSFLQRFFVTYEGPTETFKFYAASQPTAFDSPEEHDE